MGNVCSRESELRRVDRGERERERERETSMRACRGRTRQARSFNSIELVINEGSSEKKERNVGVRAIVTCRERNEWQKGNLWMDVEALTSAVVFRPFQVQLRVEIEQERDS